MRLAVMDRNGTPALGVQVDGGILDIGRALEAHPEQGVPTDVMDVIGGGGAALSALQRYVEKLGDGHPELLADPSAVEYGPCVTRPGKIICIGLNYRRHAEETGQAAPATPILFNKFNNTLTGHNRDIALHGRVTKEVDFEAELVIVIGKRTKDAERGEARSSVFGYTVVNDLSARDLQMRTSQWLLGKSLDGFSPLGPWLTTADEIADPNDLDIRTTVNGRTRQQSNTSDMIFRYDELVSYVSRHMTLEAGDLILTGTPEGVVLGDPPDRRVYLQPGDVVTIEIEGLGTLTNRMVEA